MKNLSALLFIFIISATAPKCVLKSYGQGHVVLNLPRHNIKATDTPGTVIWTRITNTTNHSITLHPLLFHNHAADSATLIRRILAQLTVTSDTDNMRLQLIKIVGHYIKSTDKTNFLPIVHRTTSSLTDRMYSLIGSELSIPYWQCGDFCREAIFILEATRFFSDSDFVINTCSIHTVMQVKLLCGDTIFTDMSVEEPGFMITNPLKRSGWASLSDIVKNTNLINGQSRYYYVNQRGDSVNMAQRSIEGYKETFRLPFKQSLFRASQYHLDNFNGDFILSAGQTIEYRDTVGYIIDTTNNVKGRTFNTALQAVGDYIAHGEMLKDTARIDSGMNMYYRIYADLLDTPVSAATILCNKGHVQLYNNSNNWYPTYTAKIPVLYTSIPAYADTIYMGIQTSAPLLVTKSTAINNGVVVDSFNVDFYAPSIISGTPPEVAYRQVNYANGLGKFRKIPPHTSVKQGLLYNYNVLNFYLGGAMFTASGSGILVEASGDATK